MSAPRHRGDADPLGLRLRSIVRALRRTSRLERAGEAFWPLPIGAILLFVVDAAWPLHELTRAGLAALFALLALRVVWALVVPARAARRAGPARAARIAEERLSLPGNPLVNALQLRALAMSGADASSGLARQAIRRGEDQSAAINARRVVDSSRMRTAWRRGLVACGLFALVAVLSPRLVAMGGMRFLNPMGDHPPFSRAVFEVTFAPDPVLVGDDVDIMVRVDGPTPDALRLEVESLGEASRESSVFLSMSRRADGFATTLRGVRDSKRLRVVSDSPRTRWIHIEPVPQPRLRGASLIVTPPEYTGLAPFSVDPADTFADAAQAAVVGSRIELWLDASLTIAQAEAGSDAEIIVAGRSAAARFTARRPGEMSLTLNAAAESGLWLEEPILARVEVIPDEPPRIEVEAPSSPGETLIATPDASAPLRAEVRDDHAIGEFQINWEIERASGASETGVVPLLPEGFAGASFDVRARFELGAVGAAPGDVVRLVFAAADTRPDSFGGAQRVETSPITINIVTKADGDPDADPGEAGGEASALIGAEERDAEAETDAAALAEAGDSEEDAKDDDDTGTDQPNASDPDAQADADASDAPPTDDGVLTGGPADTSPVDADAAVDHEGVETIRRETERAAADRLEIDSAGMAGLADLPPAYRDLVSRYFLRIARDDASQPRPGDR